MIHSHMSKFTNGKWKLLSFTLIGALISGIATMAVLGQVPMFVQQDQVNSPQLLPSAYGAGALTNVFALPSNNLFKGTGYYNIAFTTATTGTIKTIEITFPAGFNVAAAKLVQTQGAGAGSLSVSGQTVKYTITTPVSVTAPKDMTIMIANIVNPAISSNQVSVVTEDASAVVIDGPTNSATFKLTQVTSSMIAGNSITTTKLVDGQVMTNDLASYSVTPDKLATSNINSKFGIDYTECPAGVPTSSLGNVSSGGSNSFLGEVVLLPYNFAPRGYHHADGSLLQLSSNIALFSLIGTTFGGDGKTTFALPDLRCLEPNEVHYFMAVEGLFPTR